MQNILLVDDEDDILSLVKEWLDDELEHVTINCAKNGIEAIEKLKSQVSYDLIICDYYMPKSNGEEVYTYNYENEQLPFIFLTGAFVEDLVSIKNFTVDNKKNFLILKPYDEDKLLVKIKGILSGEILKEKNYQKTKISILKKFVSANLKVDLFCKLSSNKYLKILDKNTPLDLDIINSYDEKGEDYLYLDETDYQQLMSKLEHNLWSTVDGATDAKKKNIPIEDASELKILSDVFEFIHEGLHSIGIGERHIALVDKSIDTCINSAFKDKSILPFMSKLIESSNYLATHSALTAHISSIIASEMGLGSKEILTKLTYASLFQNVTIEDDYMAKIIDEKSEEFLSLDRKERKTILDHPLFAAKVLEPCTFLPDGISVLIENHHEKPDGTGFPRKVSGNYINALSAVFNLSVFIADYFCKHGFQEDKIGLLSNELKEHYSVAMFKKPAESFLKIIIDRL